MADQKPGNPGPAQIPEKLFIFSGHFTQIIQSQPGQISQVL
jgi:hypothetical protein